MTEAVSTRRRGATLERAILDAVLVQLNEVGFSALTMEGVAACAATGKAALYRRWPSKEHLVLEALQQALPLIDEVPDTGDVRKDLLVLLRRMAVLVNSPGGCAIQALLTDTKPDSSLFELIHEHVMEPRKRAMLAVLRRGVERGEVRPDAVKRIVVETGPALIVHHVLSRSGPVSDAVVRSIVDDVLLPILRP